MTVLAQKKTLIMSVVLFVLVFTAQYIVDVRMPKFDALPPFVLPGPVLRVVDLGMHSAAASLAWLEMIQNFSANPRSDFGGIERYVASVNDLDPYFAYPYAFGTLVLPEFGLIDQGIAIGQRGMQIIPDDWRIPYYAGIIYHVKKKDRAKAAELFDRAAHTPGVPDQIKAFALNYGSAGTVRQQSRAIWTSVLETSDDEIVQERARAYILHYNIIDVLEEAARRYKISQGHFPKTPADLVTGKVLKAVPQDPFGLQFTFDEQGRIKAE